MYQEASGSFFAVPAASAWGALPIPPDQSTLGEHVEFIRRKFDCAAVVLTINQPFATLLDAGAAKEEFAPRSHVCASAPAVGQMEWGGKVLFNPARLAEPLEAGDLGFGFYAGIPLRLSSECNLGTLAVLDPSPRELSRDELAMLKMLARNLVELIGFCLTTSNPGSSSTVKA